ncbi:MAG TPA: hypothetical protein VKG44_04940 [Candidatus Baltobacteraceae bacterium]|nr:hypothetical protein [Candidatus Baltobacteraceae bacterium]
MVLVLVAVPALADTVPVRVHVPYNIRTGFAITSDAPNEDQKFVTVQSVFVVNPSRYFAQSYKKDDFHLLVGDRVYYPTPRPRENAIDVSRGGILASGGRENVDVSFLVPVGTTDAKFEFTPHWQDDAGFSVDYCCLYYN